MKKQTIKVILTLVLAISMLMPNVSVSNVKAATSASFDGGDGTETNPYVINTKNGETTYLCTNDSSSNGRAYFKIIVSENAEISFSTSSSSGAKPELCESPYDSNNRKLIKNTNYGKGQVILCNFAWTANAKINLTLNVVNKTYDTSNSDMTNATELSEQLNNSKSFISDKYDSFMDGKDQCYTFTPNKDTVVNLEDLDESGNKLSSFSSSSYWKVFELPSTTPILNVSSYEDNKDGKKDGIITFLAKKGVKYGIVKYVTLSRYSYKYQISTRDYIPLNKVTLSKTTITPSNTEKNEVFITYPSSNFDGYVKEVKVSNKNVATASLSTMGPGLDVMYNTITGKELYKTVYVTPKNYGTCKIELLNEQGKTVATINVKSAPSKKISGSNMSTSGTHNSATFTFSIRNFDTNMAKCNGFDLYKASGKTYKKIARVATSSTSTYKISKKVTGLKAKSSYNFKFAPIYKVGKSYVVGALSGVYTVKTAPTSKAKVSSSKGSVSVSGKIKSYRTSSVPYWDAFGHKGYKLVYTRTPANDYYKATSKGKLSFKKVSGTTGFEYKINGNTYKTTKTSVSTVFATATSKKSQAAAKSALPSKASAKVRTYTKSKSGAICYGPWVSINVKVK